MKIDVLTIFPGMFDAVLTESITGIAVKKGIVEIALHDIRDHTKDRHRSVDDRPYGGGPGMVMKVEPVVECFEDVVERSGGARPRLVMVTPQGAPFTQETARALSAEQCIAILCGRYEGFDERIRALLDPEEISIGDYVLTGGELAAMVIVDAVVRLIPGVLGSGDSAAAESFNDGLLDYPQYTRPPAYRGLKVPEVLCSGNHEEVEKWRTTQRIRNTKAKRPDLLEGVQQ